MNPRLRENFGVASLFTLGCIFLFISYFDNTPSAHSLNQVSGELVSVSAKKGRLTVELRGNESKFGYVSFGRQCGSVYERIASLKGQRILIYYDPQLKQPMASQNYYAIYGIESEAKEICSYAAISSMRRQSNFWGIQAGIWIIVFSLGAAFMRTLPRRLPKIPH